MGKLLIALFDLLATLLGLSLHVGRKTWLLLSAPENTDGQEDHAHLERRRRENCYQLIAWVLNSYGYVCREWFERDELDLLIEGGISPEDLGSLVAAKIDDTKGLVIGHIAGGAFHLPVKLTEYYRARHVYIVGKSGSGKTTLIRNMVFQDLEEGAGVGIIAPENELLEDEVLPYIPSNRIQDVVYINPTDTAYPLSLNPLYLAPEEDIDLKVDDTTTILFRLIGSHGSGPRMEELLRQTLYALTKYPESSLLDVARFLSRQDDGFRREVLHTIKDEVAQSFFFDTYPSFPKDAHLPITNRLGKLIRPKPIQGLLCAKGPALSFRRVMDEGGILLCNLSDGILGAENASVLGQIVISRLQLAAVSRANLTPHQRRPFTVYLDEFQAFTGTSSRAYEILLSRARKYNLSMVLAHQQTGQLPTSLLKEILGNASTVICFQVGSEDARRLSHELVGELDGQMMPVEAEQLLGLGLGQAWVRIGKTVVSVRTRAVGQLPDRQAKEEAIEASRRHAAKLLPQAPLNEETAEAQSKPEAPPHLAILASAPVVEGSMEAPASDNAKEDPRSWIDRVEPDQLWGGDSDEPPNPKQANG